jgi:hypothetical protein
MRLALDPHPAGMLLLPVLPLTLPVELHASISAQIFAKVVSRCRIVLDLGEDLNRGRFLLALGTQQLHPRRLLKTSPVPS